MGALNYHQSSSNNIFQIHLVILILIPSALFLPNKVIICDPQFEPLPLPCTNTHRGRGGGAHVHYPPRLPPSDYIRSQHPPYVRRVHLSRRPPPPPPISSFWTDQLDDHNPYRQYELGGNSQEDYVPVMRVVQSYSTGPDGPDSPSQGNSAEALNGVHGK